MFQNGGLAILLKSMGLDPEGLMRQFQGAAMEAQKVIAHFDKRLTAIEKQLAEINSQLKPVPAIAEPKESTECNTQSTQ